MLDHLVYAVPDMDLGIAELTVRLGVRPAPGGRHLGLGTHNALVSLGSRAYLEIIAPDTAQPEPEHPRPFGMDTLDGPKLVAWAIGTPDIARAIKHARECGYDPGDDFEMSRQTPDGRRLSWRIALPDEPVCDGLIPFLIDWGDSVHPASSVPLSCKFLRMRGEHPEPQRVRSILDSLDVRMDVSPAQTPALVATIDSPNGRVELR